MTGNEFGSRIARLQEAAGSAGLAGILVFSWRRGAVAWFTGYRPGYVTNQAALWAPRNGRPVLAIRFPFEGGRVGGSDLFDVAPGRDPAVLPPPNARIGLLARDLAIDERSVSLMDALRDRGIEAVDLGPTVDRWRARKSPSEIEEVRRAGRIGRAAVVAAGLHAVEGETDFAIAARIEAEARRLGAFRVTCLVGIGDGAVITEATGRIVRGADPVGLEITLEAGLGCTHVTTTLPPDPPRRIDERADEACRATRRVLLEAMRPGVAVDDVVAAGDAELERRALLAFKEYDFGHGVGVETPESPRLVTGTGERLESGMTISVHVGVRRPGGETSFVGGPVVVETDGSRELVPDAPWASTATTAHHGGLKEEQ